MSVHNTLTALAMPSNSPANATKTLVKKASGGGNKKGTSAERRATHNAVERARRESLNVRFLELAANLPSTCTVRRPSKSLIVNKSLEFVEQALNAESILRLKVEDLIEENKRIMEELNDLRQERGLSPRMTTIDAGLPAPLAEHDFKMQSQRANLALSRGSISLGNGDFDDEYSAHASNSSLSSTGSPPNALRASSALPTNFQQNSKLSSSSDHATQYYMDSSHSFPGPHEQHQQQQLQQQDAFSLPTSFYSHGPTQQSTHQQSSDFIPPITPTTAAMFTQMMGAYSSSEAASDPLANASQQQQQQQHDPYHHSHDNGNNHNPSSNPLGLDETNHSAFAALASNVYFDHRYSNSVSVSTPTSTSYTTTA